MYDHCRLVRGAQAGNGPKANGKENDMLWTIALILIILWALGLVTGYTMGYFIHILLVIAIIVVLLRVIQGRKVI
jgi:low affinity Fe/Cu permease